MAGISAEEFNMTNKFKAVESDIEFRNMLPPPPPPWTQRTKKVILYKVKSWPLAGAEIKEMSPLLRTSCETEKGINTLVSPLFLPSFRLPPVPPTDHLSKATGQEGRGYMVHRCQLSGIQSRREKRTGNMSIYIRTWKRKEGGK